MNSEQPPRKPPPPPLQPGDYVLMPPSYGCEADSSHTGMVTRVLYGHPLRVTLMVDSSRCNIVLYPREFTQIQYDEVTFHGR